MSTHFNQLSPAEAERLALLAEECAEVIQIVGKILRHGYLSHNPNKPEAGTNQAMLENELGDVRAVTDLLIESSDVSGEMVAAHARSKLRNAKPYLHHQ